MQFFGRILPEANKHDYLHKTEKLILIRKPVHITLKTNTADTP